MFCSVFVDVLPSKPLSRGAGVICVSNEAAEVGHDDSGRSLTAKEVLEQGCSKQGCSKLNSLPQGAKLAILPLDLANFPCKNVWGGEGKDLIDMAAIPSVVRCHAVACVWIKIQYLRRFRSKKSPDIARVLYNPSINYINIIKHS
jgi:hypothetical protein